MVTKTLAQLRTALLIRAGMNSSGTSVDLTSTVLNEIINDALYEGRDVIVGKWLDYFTTSAQISVLSGTDVYPLPHDFYKFRALWIADGARQVRLYPVDLDAANEYTGQTVGTKGAYRYRMMGRNIIMMPVPASAESLTLHYIPAQPELVNDTDAVNFEVPIELKYCLAVAWRDVLDRQNLDPSPALAKIDAYEKKLRVAADNRNAGEPFYLNPRGPFHDDDWDEVL